MFITIFILTLFAVFIVISVISGLFITILNRIASLFMHFRRNRSNNKGDTAAGNSNPPHQTMRAKRGGKHKVIDSSDGEYVDFEEIKRGQEFQ